VLTLYGRAQGDLLLRTRYGKESPDEAAEPSPTAGFLFGAWETPEWLLAGGSLRGLALVNKVGDAPADVRFVQMQADLRAMIRPSFVRAGGSIGFAHQGALPAAITSMPDNNLVSREHWAGVAFDEDAFLVRAGRMNLPFGVRNVDHTLWVRTATRTDINTAQQHGVAFAYSGEKLRAEVMGIVGNLQLHPDAYRERGAAGYVELLRPRWAVGASGLFGTTLLDLRTRTTLRRGAAGLFGRVSPATPLVLTSEVDALIDGPAGKPVTAGVVGMLQADYEPLQGVHVLGTGELQAGPSGTSAGGWLGAWWFFLPHADVRVDGVIQSVASPGQRTLVRTFLAQLHLYL
jgi:hypothetical protein